ncbi:hypothetical protein WQ57_05870 [Mesobacillus campisalis]|uniref:Uncharacterized protein n=1 Tax=Mesobacillus campisalis TaxID=1408103 RepID=A0A0M2SYV0_9BACI|nr:hypothetical protein WQ57_05870 [Mesobacillus campisalis]
MIGNGMGVVTGRTQVYAIPAIIDAITAIIGSICAIIDAITTRNDAIPQPGAWGSAPNHQFSPPQASSKA